MLVCSKKEYLIRFSVNFSVLFYLYLEGVLTYEYYETLDSINRAEQCFEFYFFSISYARKFYSTHVLFHIFMSSSVHLKIIQHFA